MTGKRFASRGDGSPRTNRSAFMSSPASTAPGHQRSGVKPNHPTASNGGSQRG